MSIGTTIKKLRRERDMTQEQLAELLGITANAVSQWECDRTAPDIAQLPALANIFRVSADVLLGIDVSSKDARIEEIYNEVRELWCTARRDEAEKLCREGLAEFPDAYLLMEELAWNLSYSNERKELEESIALFERIRTGTVDENTRNFAVGTLCDLYMKIGNAETAKQLAESVPVMIYSREACLRMTLRGTEWADCMRKQIAGQFGNFIMDLRNLTRAFGDEHPLFDTDELLKLWQKVIDLTTVFYEDGDYAFDEQWIIEAYYRRARLFLKREETASALDALEAMLKHIEHYDTYADGMLGNHIVLSREKWHTSILVRPLDENDPSLAQTVSAMTTENAAMEYLKELANVRFDSIREQVRFKTVEEQLKQTAHE